MASARSTPAGPPPRHVSVLRGPVAIDRGVLRIVALADGSGRVECWAGAERGWVPGGADVAEFFFAPPASAALRTRLGVPPDDWS